MRCTFDFPGLASRASIEDCLITRDCKKGWREWSAGAGRCGTLAMTAATSPSGGKALGTWRNPSNRDLSSSNSARAAGSAPRRRSSSSASSGLASPSRTACINWVRSKFLISVQVLKQVAKALPRLEQARLYRLLVQVQDLTDLLIAALGEVPQRQDRPVVRCHLHQRAPDPACNLCCAGLPFRVGTFGAGKVDPLVERFLPPVPAQEVERLVDRNAVDPAEELEPRIIFVQPLRNLEKHDLGDVIRVLGLAQHPECGVVDRPLVADHQFGKGSPIAIPAALDQRNIGIIVHNYTRRSGKLGRCSVRH